MNNESAEKFLLRLTKGGAIYSSNDCTDTEIAQADSRGNFFVLAENGERFGFGFVYFPKGHPRATERKFAGL